MYDGEYNCRTGQVTLNRYSSSVLRDSYNLPNLDATVNKLVGLLNRKQAEHFAAVLKRSCQGEFDQYKPNTNSTHNSSDAQTNAPTIGTANTFDHLIGPVNDGESGSAEVTPASIPQIQFPPPNVDSSPNKGELILQFGKVDRPLDADDLIQFLIQEVNRKGIKKQIDNSSCRRLSTVSTASTPKETVYYCPSKKPPILSILHK